MDTRAVVALMLYLLVLVAPTLRPGDGALVAILGSAPLAALLVALARRGPAARHPQMRAPLRMGAIACAGGAALLLVALALVLLAPGGPVFSIAYTSGRAAVVVGGAVGVAGALMGSREL